MLSIPRLPGIESLGFSKKHPECTARVTQNLEGVFFHVRAGERTCITGAEMMHFERLVARSNAFYRAPRSVTCFSLSSPYQ